MKKTKHIIIAAIAVSVITLGAVVACNKEHNTLTETNVPSTKNNPDEKALLHYVRTIWQKSDKIIKMNPSAVDLYCNTEDVSAFLALAGISNSLVDITAMLMKDRITSVTIPDTYDTTVCHSCNQDALSKYVDQCRQLRNVLDSIHMYEPNFNDTLIITLPPFPSECEYLCWRAYGNNIPVYFNDKLLVCILNCYIKEHMKDAKDTLHELMYQYKPNDD